MKHEHENPAIIASYDLIETKPTDRLDHLNKSLQVKQIILRCMLFLDNLRVSPYLTEYTDEDLKHIHEAVRVSAIPLLQLTEYFLDKTLKDTEEHSLAV